MTQDEIIRMAREACLHNQTLDTDPEFLTRFAALVAAHEREKQAEQELVGEMVNKAGYKGAAWYLEPPATGTKLYAAPVRTKDLTDAFINELHKDAQDPISFARAVIAADREKNK